ncbi:hypothetical protein [Streptomyces sp. NPDC002845]
MRVRIAVLVLRLPLGQRSRWRLGALVTVVRAADAGVPAAMRAVAGALESLGPETVWRTWAEPPAAGPSRRRWTSPLVAELLDRDSARISDVLVDAGWRDWLDAHEDELWSLLRHWNRAPTASEPQVRFLSRLALDDGDGCGGTVDARMLADAAARFDHPIGERARALLLTLSDSAAVDLFCRTALESPEAAAFCAGHHLAPADQVQRAVFFVRTGQLEQYRALDPDGSLLALGYRGACAEERLALRTAMSGLGILDVLRVLAGQGSQQADFTSFAEHERAYLVEQLADRRDWDRLWSLTLLMPLPEAVRAADEFGDWRPSGEDERRVFEALRAADSNAVTRFVDALAGTGSLNSIPRTRIWPTDPDEESIAVHALDFAPDGTQLAFAGRGTGHCAGIVDLAGLTLVWLEDDLPHPAQWIAHLGSDTMIVVARGQIHYADETGTRALDTAPSDGRGVERIAGDRAFIVPARNLELTGEWAMFVGDSDGPFTDSGIPLGRRLVVPRGSAVDAQGRLIAVVGENSNIVVADIADSAVNKLIRPEATGYGMQQVAISPSAFVCGTVDGGLHVWHEPLTTSQAPITTRPWTYRTSPIHLAWSHALDRFLAVTGTHLQLLDVPPTRDTPMPDDPVSEQVPLLADTPRATARCARVSPRGDLLAVGDLEEGTVDIYVLTALTLRPFIADPMGVMSHKDLTKVVAVMEHPVLNEMSRQALGLLRTCLEHRLRHDVGIGEAAGSVRSAGSAVAGDYEIELGEHPERGRPQERKGDA